MRDSFIKRLSEMARKDPRILLVTGDLGFGVFDEYRRVFPRQFVNVGVAEQNMIGLATGLALEGHIVFTYSIANFAFMRCLEQIRNDAAYHEANVNVVCIGGGFSYGPLGISHHATEDLAIMRSLPEVTVVSPCDTWEAAEATEAVAHHPGVSYLRLDKSSAELTNQPGEEFQLGNIRTMQHGRAITLASAGGVMGEVNSAAQQLRKYGIECRVLSVHTIKPLDKKTIVRASQETGGIITIEEHTVHGGLGSVIAETLLDEGASPRVFYRIGLRGGFASAVGSQAFLRRKYQLDAQEIVTKTMELLRPEARRPNARRSNAA